MNKKAILAEDLLAEIERQESLLGKCDRLEVDNVKEIIRDFPALFQVRCNHSPERAEVDRQLD